MPLYHILACSAAHTLKKGPERALPREYAPLNGSYLKDLPYTQPEWGGRVTTMRPKRTSSMCSGL